MNIIGFQAFLSLSQSILLITLSGVILFILTSLVTGYVCYKGYNRYRLNGRLNDKDGLFEEIVGLKKNVIPNALNCQGQSIELPRQPLRETFEKFKALCASKKNEKCFFVFATDVDVDIDLPVRGSNESRQRRIPADQIVIFVSTEMDHPLKDWQIGSPITLTSPDGKTKTTILTLVSPFSPNEAERRIGELLTKNYQLQTLAGLDAAQPT